MLVKAVVQNRNCALNGVAGRRLPRSLSQPAFARLGFGLDQAYQMCYAMFVTCGLHVIRSQSGASADRRSMGDMCVVDFSSLRLIPVLKCIVQR